jgi:histidyl-tRNA synthetase
MKSQMKVADRSGATFAVIVGSNELEAGEVVVRPMRTDDAPTPPRRGPVHHPRTDLIEYLQKAMS